MTIKIASNVAKKRLGHLMDLAAAGEEIVITKNGVPYARILPLERAPIQQS